MRAAARSRGREAGRGGAEIPTAARSGGEAERANGPDLVYITLRYVKPKAEDGLGEGKGR